jgi:hypothetical protein
MATRLECRSPKPMKSFTGEISSHRMTKQGEPGQLSRKSVKLCAGPQDCALQQKAQPTQTGGTCTYNYNRKCTRRGMHPPEAVARHHTSPEITTYHWCQCIDIGNDHRTLCQRRSSLAAHNQLRGPLSSLRSLLASAAVNSACRPLPAEPQYLLIPKIRTLCSCGNLAMRSQTTAIRFSARGCR